MSAQDDGKYYASEGLKVSNIESTILKKQQECIAYVQPRTAPQTSALATANSAVWEFNLPTGANLPHYLHDHLLELQLNNADAVNAMGLVDGIMMFNSIETLINGAVVKTQYPQAIRHTLLLGNQTEKLATKLASLGISATTHVSTLSIPAASSVTVRIPFQTLLTTSSFPMWSEKVRVSIRFTMNGGAALIRTGTAVASSLSVTASSVRLILLGHRMRPEVLVDANMRLTASPKTYKYLNAQQQKNGVAVTAGSPVSINITSPGHLSHYFLQVTPAVPTGSQLSDSYAITAFDFLSSGSVIGSFMGDNGLTTSMLNILGSNFWENVIPLTNLSIYWYSFSEDPVKDLSGSNNGSIPVTGLSETIRFTTTATTDATAVAVFTGLYHSRVTVDFNSGVVTLVRNSLDL